MLRGGLVSKGRFCSISGAPTRLKGQVAADVVLRHLWGLGILNIESSEQGELVTFGRNVPFESPMPSTLRARAMAEDIMLSAFHEWLRKNGLISFSKAKLRPIINHDGEMPEYGHFEWDLTAPSYMHPLAVRSENHAKPGFIVADISLGARVTVATMQAFLKKVSSIRGQRIPQALTIFVADEFDDEAWALGREKGVWFTTPSLLLGREVAQALEMLVNVLSNAAAAVSKDWPRIEQMLIQIGRIEGAAMNIRGATV